MIRETRPIAADWRMSPLPSSTSWLTGSYVWCTSGVQPPSWADGSIGRLIWTRNVCVLAPRAVADDAALAAGPGGAPGVPCEGEVQLLRGEVDGLVRVADLDLGGGRSRHVAPERVLAVPRERVALVRLGREALPEHPAGDLDLQVDALEIRRDRRLRELDVDAGVLLQLGLLARVVQAELAARQRDVLLERAGLAPDGRARRLAARLARV